MTLDGMGDTMEWVDCIFTDTRDEYSDSLIGRCTDMATYADWLESVMEQITLGYAGDHFTYHLLSNDGTKTQIDLNIRNSE